MDSLSLKCSSLPPPYSPHVGKLRGDGVIRCKKGVKYELPPLPEQPNVIFIPIVECHTTQWKSAQAVGLTHPRNRRAAFAEPQNSSAHTSRLTDERIQLACRPHHPSASPPFSPSLLVHRRSLSHPRFYVGRYFGFSAAGKA